MYTKFSHSLIYSLILEQTVQDKSEAKKKEEQSLHKRLNEQEMLKQEKEDLWKKEKMRRSSADKPWDVDGIGSREETSKAEKGEEMSQLESAISVSKLEETILKVQQQMSEGSDHINFELKMKEKHKSNSKFGDNDNKEKADVQQTTRDSFSSAHSSPKKKISPNKIKVRVEVEKSSKQSSKIDKKLAANTIVQLMVPFFKEGKITSREVFKCCAKEFTTLMLEFDPLCDTKYHEPIPLSQYSKYIKDFFSSSSTISTEDDVKMRLGKFKHTLNKK